MSPGWFLSLDALFNHLTPQQNSLGVSILTKGQTLPTFGLQQHLFVHSRFLPALFEGRPPKG